MTGNAEEEPLPTEPPVQAPQDNAQEDDLSNLDATSDAPLNS